MDFATFRATILGSDSDDWHVLAGSIGFPLKSGTGDLDLYEAGHKYIAHYKPDIDISIAWGADQNDGEPWGPGHGGWGKSFPDSKVYGFFADLRWRGTLVQRELVCSADGGRYYMPIMDGDEPEGGWGAGNPVTRWKVRPSAIPLPKLLHDMHLGHDFDEGLARTGAEVVDY